MPNWIWTGLRHANSSTDWPRADQGQPDPCRDGQQGVLGFPRLNPAQACAADCQRCVESCPTQAISYAPASETGQPAHDPRIGIDYGRCIQCQACVFACPDDGPLELTHHWPMATRDRQRLRHLNPDTVTEPAQSRLRHALLRRQKHSLHIRHIDAGSCNGCESELQALDNPFYNLHRLGIFFTPSPRFADLLLVTGVVTPPTRALIERTFEAMPDPKWVLAAGTCAVSGAPFDTPLRGMPSTQNGLSDSVPVDVWLPGCPPNPAALIQGLLVLLERDRERIGEITS
ncbi:hydrogenase [Sulfuriferula plumbiphila]|uniref:Hydrogenase n=1 Tax=Sulfuriferula plumbiphila TaxID=171865 RepID=A0A512LCK6_9PROT|nr:4Fe-4S dicluster domain-containing protein [Sulfuriferula plumbiphila]BBP04786.1 hydrogenase [Sulfuriferula plumbiphila]GEP32132.1 hydrogenase [Sulfuriferula plumbiphila]